MICGLRITLLAGSACAAVAMPSAVLAQVAGTQDAAPPSGAASAQGSDSTQTSATVASGTSDTPQDDGLEEIVVTANKRNENLNDVGQTITAISGELLAERRIVSVQDVAAAVPGLTFAQSGTNTPIFTLRGVGFNETTLGVFPAVSVYVDEVPLQFPVMTLRSAFDLERIEALKGPQGTLFGQNSTGGAINYIAAKPTNDLQYGGDISYGRFNQFDGNLFVSGPVSETLGVRLAVTGLTSDGYQRSYTRPGDRNGRQRYIAGRFITSWEPSEALRVSLNLNGWHDTSEPQATQLIAIRPQQPANIQPALLNYPFSPQNPRAADFSTGRFAPRSNRDFYQAALRVDYDLTPDITLTSLTSYNRLDQSLSSDQDGSALLVANLSPSDGRIRTFNQELRVASATRSGFRWVVGGNYEKDRTFEDQTLNFGNGSSSNPSTLFINTTGSINRARIENYAVFANGEFDIAEQITLKAGGRYTNSTNNTLLRGIANGDGNVAGLFNILGGLLGSVPFTPITTGGDYVLNENLVPGFPFLDRLKEDNFSWRVGADYRATEDILFYANVSRGYKAGSYPTLSASTFQQFQPVTQESVTSYEAGGKASLFDRRVQINAAAFYYNYKDKQIRGKIVDPVFDVLDILINVPKSRVYGAELDVTVRPLRSLTLQGGLTYLNSRVQRYTGPTVYGNVIDFSGVDLPFTPKFSYSLNADYRPEAGAGGAPFAGVSIRGQSKSASTLNGEDITFTPGPSNRILAGIEKPFVLKSYATVDARLGYEFADGRYSVMLFGKNIFNEYYFTNSAQFLDVTVRYPGLPATYGVTLSFKN